MSRRARLSGVFAALAPLYRLYFRTLRFRALLPDGSTIHPGEYPFERRIFALCERDALAIAGIMAGRGFTILISLGRDGDWATATVEKLGGRVVRGSSRRGGVRALAGLIGVLSNGAGPAGVVVDGPLGPSGEPKPGVLLCAAKTGREVVPLGVAARPALVFRKAWSKLFVPWPFARVLIVCERSMTVREGAPRDEIDALTRELAARLAAARRTALESV